MSARIFALSLTAVALTVVPAMAEELLMGDSVVQSDGYDGGCCKVKKDCTPQCCCEPLWTFRAGVLVLKQESPSEAKEFDFDFEAGIDVSAIRRRGECHALEVRYMGVDDWDDRLTFEPGGVGYSSDLHSTEINLRRQWIDRISTLAGFRWVELREEMSFASSGRPLGTYDSDNHVRVPTRWRSPDMGSRGPVAGYQRRQGRHLLQSS